jgi:putative transposase
MCDSTAQKNRTHRARGKALADIEAHLKYLEDATEHIDLLPKGWVVERTFGWLSWCRRLNRDRECLPETSETWIYIAMIRIMVRRLA